MKYSLMAVLLGGTALVLSGCASTCTVSGERTTGPGGSTEKIGGSCTWTRSANALSTIFGGTSALQSAIASLSLNLTGTNVGVENSGLVLINIKDENNNKLGANAFSWHKNGDKIELDDPAAASTWAGPMSNAAKLEFTFPSISLETTTGINAFMFALEENGNPLAAGGEVWTENVTVCQDGNLCLEP